MRIKAKQAWRWGRGRLVFLWNSLRTGVGSIPPRRVWATAMALLLWLEMGGMAGSALPEAERSGFGDVHWYEEA